MPAYQAPLRDMRFLLYELHGADALAKLPGYQEATRDLLDSVLDAAAAFTAEKLLPLNRTGDEEGCRFENGIVRRPRASRRPTRNSPPAAGFRSPPIRPMAARACPMSSTSWSRR